MNHSNVPLSIWRFLLHLLLPCSTVLDVSRFRYLHGSFDNNMGKLYNSNWKYRSRTSLELKLYISDTTGSFLINFTRLKQGYNMIHHINIANKCTYVHLCTWEPHQYYNTPGIYPEKQVENVYTDQKEIRVLWSYMSWINVFDNRYTRHDLQNLLD